MTIGCLCCNAQIFDMLNSDIYRGRVKLVSEFMERFNGDEKNPYIDPNADEIDKINLCQLFNIDFILKNRSENEPKAFQFVDSVLNHDVKLHYSNPDWYAKTTCIATFKGKEVKFDLFLVVEPRGNDMYKWVIADVDGDIFDLKPSKSSDQIMLLPNEHESNFMRLYSITNGKDDLITLYSISDNNTERLTVFNTLVYYGLLNIEYIDDVEFTFLQVPGYLFTIREFERESTNSGWLIDSWFPISNEEKSLMLEKLYGGCYAELILKRNNLNMVNSIDEPVQEINALQMVETFVKSLSKYIEDRDISNLDTIENLVKGRYSFRISDNISDNLANFFRGKSAKSYTLENLINWLGHPKSQIKSITANNIKIVDNDIIKSKFAENFSLVECDISTTGDLEIQEHVIFFIYQNQIAAIKIISNCI